MSTTATEIAVKGIDIHTYLVKDSARAIAFYRDVIGLPVSLQLDQGAEFELGDGSTFGVWQMRDGSWHPSAGVVFAVDDLNKAVELYKERGVTFVDEPIETEACFMAFCADTEGNSFLLHQRKG